MTTRTDILLVEDSAADAELTLHVFKRYKIANRIEVVQDGAEALEFLFHTGPYSDREDLPKFVLLDLKLPKVGGVEVLEKLKANPVTRKIPVVVLTSSRVDSDLEKCYELGVNSYIVKPVDFAQFGEAIRQIGLYWLVLNELPIPKSVKEDPALALVP